MTNFDIRRVSDQFRAQVADAISGGVKDAADTKEEFAKLGEMLGGCKNEHEVGYVKTKMEEYEVKYKLADLRNRASDYVRRTVDNIKSRFKPKKALDLDEAKSLADELRRAIEENRIEDEEYIREELKQQGYGDLVKEIDKEQADKKQFSAPIEKAEKPCQPGEGTNDKTGKAEEHNKGKEVPNVTPKPKKPIKKAPPKKAEPQKEPPKEEPKEPSIPLPTKPEVPQKKTEKFHIDEESQANGYGAANDIIDEKGSFFTSDDKIKDKLMKIDRKTAFSFVGALKGRTPDGKVFSSLKDNITYKEMQHVGTNLLNQAKDMNLVNSNEYKALKDELAFVKRLRESEGEEKEPTPNDVSKMDKLITNLYKEMNKVIEK